jgi:hypothetical protein
MDTNIKNINLNDYRDNLFEQTNKTIELKNSNNIYTLKLNSSLEEISLPVYISNFIDIAEELLRSYMNINSSKYDVKNISINKLKSNEILLKLKINNSEVKTRCVIEVAYNGLEIIKKLYTYNDLTIGYILEKKNKENNKINFIDNYIINLI